MKKMFEEMVDLLEEITEDEFAEALNKATSPKVTKHEHRACPFVDDYKTIREKRCAPKELFEVSFITKKPGIHIPVKELIERVIFQDPATIVFWKDGTKTVVKTQGTEKYDKEKGLAMCVVKYISGNKGMYYEMFKDICNAEKTDEETDA